MKVSTLSSTQIFSHLHIAGSKVRAHRPEQLRRTNSQIEGNKNTIVTPDRLWNIRPLRLHDRKEEGDKLSSRALYIGLLV